VAVLDKTTAGLKGVALRGRLFEICRPFPLMGHIAFGIIDRGYNILQVRVSSLCPLSCPFCSVDAGPITRRRRDFILTDPEWLAEWLKRACRYKGRVHVLFDAAGEPLTNPLLPDFVSEVKGTGLALSIAVETRLYPTDREMLLRLVESGVNRFNISIDTLNPEKARWLSGSNAYNLDNVLDLTLFLNKELGVNVHITPLWIPGVNDGDIEEIIRWVQSVGIGGKVPPLGIQKYVEHRHGRKIPGVKEWSWSLFYRRLRELEEKYNIRLVLRPEDYGLEVAPRALCPYRRGSTVKLYVIGEAWLPNEYLAVTTGYDRAVTLISKSVSLSTRDIITARITSDRDGILLARPV